MTPKLVRRIVDALKKDAARQNKRCDLTVAIDAGGVGEGLAQGITQEMPLEDCRAVYLTGGSHGYRTEDSNVFVAEGHMVALLVGAIETRRVHFPRKLKETEAMREEMTAYGEKISEETGNSSYGAMSTGAHDDLITSCGLCLVIGEICRPARLF